MRVDNSIMVSGLWVNPKPNEWIATLVEKSNCQHDSCPKCYSMRIRPGRSHWGRVDELGSFRS